ncbi:MAG: DsbA family protein [Syntrophorhabdaceae bacterium]
MKKLNLIFVFLTIFLMLFCGSSNAQTGKSGGNMGLVSFGKGPVEARFYSNYFCGACKSLEPTVEYLIADLVKRDIITISFIDLPKDQQSVMYARYFLYILNYRKDIQHALKARSALFEAASQNIADKDKLEAYLTSKGFKFKQFDPKPVFTILQNHLMNDQIRATPTCVTVRDGKKEFYQGSQNITSLLESLK